MTDRLTYRTVLDHIRDTARSGGYTRRLDLALWTVARARESLASMACDDMDVLSLARSALDLAETATATHPMSTSDRANLSVALRIVTRWRRRLCEVRERDAAEIARLAEHWDGYSDVPSVGTEIRVPRDPLGIPVLLVARRSL